MVQIALWPGNVMNTLRYLFKERYTVRTERQTDALLIFSASPTIVYKNFPLAKKSEVQCTPSAGL